MLMTPCRRSTRKDVYAGTGRRTIRQRHAPRTFADEIEIAIEHSFDPGMQPVTPAEAAELRSIACFAAKTMTEGLPDGPLPANATNQK